MANITRGQITITDLNDGRTLSLFLQPTLGGKTVSTTQIYDYNSSTKATSYSPNYGSGLVITPYLYASGIDGNQNIANSSTIQSCIWKVDGVQVTTDTTQMTMTTTAPYTLTIKKNLTSDNMVISCDMVFVDPATKITSPAHAELTLTKINNTGQTVWVNAYPLTSLVFANGKVSSLKAKADLYRGGTIDTSDVTYQWQKLNVSTGAWVNFTGTGATTNTVTVNNSDVDNIDFFRCVITDTDNASQTKGKTFTSQPLNFQDLSDPFVVDFIAPAGYVLTPAAPSTTLTARVTQNGEEISETQYTNAKFTWTKYDKNGNKVADWTPTYPDSKKPWIIRVTRDDISVKATFFCDVTGL